MKGREQWKVFGQYLQFDELSDVSNEKTSVRICSLMNCEQCDLGQYFASWSSISRFDMTFTVDWAATYPRTNYYNRSLTFTWAPNLMKGFILI